MWQSVATYVSTFFESGFPLQQQKRLTLGVLILIAAIGILLLLIIGWADFFYA